MTSNPISAREAFAQIDARRRVENPWTTADEARCDARRARERASQEAWEIANPDVEEDEEDEEDEE